MTAFVACAKLQCGRDGGGGSSARRGHELVAALKLAAHAEPALPLDASPYPGLAAYGAADRGVFVGRERDVEELLQRLGTQPIVTVVGPSGIGKTSFLAAGLVPALAPGWRAALIRPGGDPLGALAAITERGAPPFAQALIARAAPDGLLIVVDQAEELFTMCGDDARRAAFAEALVTAAASPQIRVVLALRDDFLCRVEQLAP